MAEHKRVRIESHIEVYLLTHAQRVLHKPASAMTPQDYSTLVNALIYEHKLAHGFLKTIPFTRILDWFYGLIAAVPGKLSFISPQKQEQVLPTAEEPEDLSFYTQLGQLYEQEVA